MLTNPHSIHHFIHRLSMVYNRRGTVIWISQFQIVEKMNRKHCLTTFEFDTCVSTLEPTLARIYFMKLKKKTHTQSVKCQLSGFKIHLMLLVGKHWSNTKNELREKCSQCKDREPSWKCHQFRFQINYILLTFSNKWECFSMCVYMFFFLKWKSWCFLIYPIPSKRCVLCSKAPRTPIQMTRFKRMREYWRDIIINVRVRYWLTIVTQFACDQNT